MKDFRWALEIHREDGTVIDQVPVSVDFEAAREYALFTGMRKNLLAADEVAGRSSIFPRWHPDDGQPFLEGFRVRFDDAADEATLDFDKEYFRPTARSTSVTLVAEGKLREGEVFRFRPLAFPVAGGAPAVPIASAARDISPGLSLRETRLADFTARSTVEGSPQDDDFPVFVPEHVLDEMRELSRGAGDHETGGFLVGQLHRDASIPEIFLEITAQIPAKHVISATDRLTFTERTWTDAQAVLDLRQRGEQWTGYWHRHPVSSWCRNCAPEKQRVCRLAKDFFSEQDRQVQRAVFSRAYNVALVFNDVAFDDSSFSLFGWRRGDIQPRGFHRLAGETPEREERAHGEDA